MAKKNESIGNKLKNVAVNTVKATAKDLLTVGTIVGPGKVVKGASVAAKAIKTAQAVKKLAPEEKYAVKMVKNIQKTGKPGDVQKTLDKLPPKTKQDIAKALKKAKGSAPVKSRAPKATPDLMKVRNRRTGELKNFKPQ